MSELSTKSCLIADHGLFVELAAVLARDFGKVMYFSPWASGYPSAAPAHIGFGLPDVERVDLFWDAVGDADVVVFPDLYFSDWAAVVKEKFGKPVWSHQAAEMLELDRRGTRKLQRSLSIAAPRTRYFTGVDELADYLKGVEDRWVKISCFRGDGETWHHDTWHTTSVYLDHFRNRVGALAQVYEFMVESPIEGIEIGYDGWTVKGEFPSSAYWGFEVKDKGYIGQFSLYESMPPSIRDINAAFSGILREEEATGFCSFECRLGRDKKPVLIDPCMRCGSPPFEGTQEGYANLAQIIWEGAHGRMAAPESSGKYIAMAMIHSQFALTNWVPIDCPPEVRRWLKLRNAAVIEGKLYHVPTGNEMPEIGAVVAVDDDLEKACSLVKERAEQIKGHSLEIHVGALDNAQEEINRAREYGVEF